MAAQGSCQCALLGTRVPIPLKPPPHALLLPSFARSFVASRACRFRVRAGFGGEGEVQKGGKKKKFITKEEEPEQYWQTAGEREGENPMMTPLPYIIIFGMSTPFVILAIAFANGWIKVPVR
ncbi:hypothetical protein MLD38_031737 [Melastoma candidum]|uniref:Uncharacterized protein n=1 Tax=Melastoma candidum TaxID=119954 RepID=A0ACB9MSF3_9MYRT|nr:hypothetical protein MLD38_031737 [Melastoma candidum]